jgi:hypothetical protein
MHSSLKQTFLGVGDAAVQRRTVEEERLEECVEQHERCEGERDKVPRLQGRA